MMPGKSCTNHKLSYSLFSNCRQNVRMQLCTSITNTLYRTPFPVLCLFFPYSFLILFLSFLMFSFCLYLADLTLDACVLTVKLSKSNGKKQSSVPWYFWVCSDWHYYSLDWFIFLILFKNWSTY